MFASSRARARAGYEPDAIRVEPLRDGSDLRRFAGCFPTGVAVVTVKDEAGWVYGTTMNAVTSLSLDPPLYLMCFGKRSNTFPVLLRIGAFCLNFLAAHQERLARVFASKNENKMADVEFSTGRNGLPILEGVVAACEGRVVGSYPGGDHVIIIGRVEHAHVSEREPLVFHRGKYRRF